MSFDQYLVKSVCLVQGHNPKLVGTEPPQLWIQSLTHLSSSPWKPSFEPKIHLLLPLLVLPLRSVGLATPVYFSFSQALENYNNKYHLSHIVRKPDLAYAKTKAQISFAVTAKLISAFVFATRIVQFLFYL